VSAITKSRALQIVNNVAEEWNDHGSTNFATKKELCATIQWLTSDQRKELQRKDTALDKISVISLTARLYRRALTRPPAKTEKEI
jgi:hypothetical protein